MRCADVMLGPNLRSMFHDQESGEQQCWATINSSAVRKPSTAGVQVYISFVFSFYVQS